MKSIVEKIIEKKGNKRFIVGINGVDTSGKTTFTRKLKKELENKGFHVETISIDDFHNESEIRYKNPDPIQGYIDDGFDLENLENFLREIKQDNIEKKKMIHLNLDNDTFSNEKIYTFKDNTVILLEGVLLYREPINKYFDFKIFLEIPFEEVLKRAEKRDVPKFGIEFLDKYRNKYIPVQKKYLREYKVKETCDLIIDNTDFDNPIII